MAQPTKSDRLSPPIMFAFHEAHRAKDSRKAMDLRDDSGMRIIAGRRSVKGSVTENQLREQLATDLNSLLNTINLDSAMSLAETPHVRASILNYGLPEISNRTIEEYRTLSIVDEIKEALILFEPRLIPDTIKVRRDQTVSVDSLNVRFTVAGEMACDPVAVAVEFFADIDVESGALKVGRRH